MSEQPPPLPPSDNRLPPPPPGEARRRWREAHQLVGPLPPEAYTSWGRRVGAFLIDRLLVLALIAILIVVLGFGGGLILGAVDGSERADRIFESVTALVYWVVLLAYWIWNWGYRQGITGASIGKSLMKFKVVDERDGQPIGFGRSVVRQIAHFLDGLCYIGYLMPLFTAKRQTFADMIMGTVCLPTEPAPAPQQPHPAYGARPPPGTPDQHYAWRPHAGHPAPRRPGTVTAAAVFAFATAVLLIIIGLVSVYKVSHLHLLSDGVRSALYVSTLTGVVFGALFIWGGSATVRGRTDKVLLWTSLATVIPCVVNIGITLTGYHRFLGFLCLALAAVIVSLLLQQPSKDFFRARASAD